MNCGTCVVLPHPVAPEMTHARDRFTAEMTSARAFLAGKPSRIFCIRLHFSDDFFASSFSRSALDISLLRFSFSAFSCAESFFAARETLSTIAEAISSKSSTFSSSSIASKFASRASSCVCLIFFASQDVFFFGLVSFCCCCCCFSSSSSSRSSSSRSFCFISASSRFAFSFASAAKAAASAAAASSAFFAAFGMIFFFFFFFNIDMAFKSDAEDRSTRTASLASIFLFSCSRSHRSNLSSIVCGTVEAIGGTEVVFFSLSSSSFSFIFSFFMSCAQ